MSNFPLVRPPRVIVADDQEWILQILGQVTRQTLPLAEVVQVVDGRQALEAYQNGRCDFLVTNHTMPNMDGLELIRAVRAQSPALPIVMVSVHPEVASDAVEAGANWFLTKEQIMERLPALLQAHTRGGAAGPSGVG